MFRVLSARIATLALVAGAASAVGGSASAVIGDCASLNGTAIPAASIGLPTGGALVTSTTLADTPVANCQVNGRIDQKLFEDSVGTLVWALASSDRRLRIYGEMVDVLASRGDFRIALQLEARWNELRAETPFTLFCGYSSENFGDPKVSDALQLTCQAHSHIRTNPRDPLATFLLESASSGPGTS